MALSPTREQESPTALDSLGATVQTNLQTHQERHPSHHAAVPGIGETYEQHAQHDLIAPKAHWGLSPKAEATLFYCCAVPSWGLEIAAAVVGSYSHSWNPPFIVCISAFLVLHWMAWLQTAVGMMQRASWVRDESDLNDRRQFLHLAVRLNRLMMVCTRHFSLQDFPDLAPFENLLKLIHHKSAHSSNSLVGLHSSLCSPLQYGGSCLLASVPAHLHLEHRFFCDECLQQYHVGVGSLRLRGRWLALQIYKAGDPGYWSAE